MMKVKLLFFCFLIGFASCNLTKFQIKDEDPIKPGTQLLNPALPGDNPDPSIIRVGNTYYATSTTNEWAPYFTIYKSTDLKSWKLINHVFPEGFKDMKNQWGENNFWASELAYDAKQKRIYAYYTAHNRNIKGNPGLQCGVAWIDVEDIETGKFVDNGPIIIEEDCGAIDAFEMRDKDKIYVFWKNDGNGCGKETWIWMQEINESRTALLGEKKKLFTNSQSWENALVEGACFFKKGDYYYSLYAVGGCCDARCDYKTGIARTKDLASGNWEKYDKNPIMVSNERWRCPGHGTAFDTPDGRLFMVYHAFNNDYNVFVGREGIIEEMTINEDGWPVLHNATTANRPLADLNYFEDFTKAKNLSLVWQWPSKLVKPTVAFDGGLVLAASNENHKLGTFLGQYIKTVNFEATAKVEVTDADAGVCLGGAIYKSKWPGELGAIGVTVSKSGLKVFDNLEKNFLTLKTEAIPAATHVELKLQLTGDGKVLEFYYKLNREWKKFYTTRFNASKYAPWGMGYRIGLVVKGEPNQKGKFGYFDLTNL